MEKVKIEKNIPLPERYTKLNLFPWEEMKEGDSFFVAGDKPNRNTVQKYAMQWAQENNTILRLVSDIEKDGRRYWVAKKGERVLKIGRNRNS